MKVLMLASSVDTNRGPDGFIADWVRVLGQKVDSLTVLTYNHNPQEELPANTKVIKINGNNFLTRNIDLVLKVFKYSKENDVIFAHILEVFGIIAGIIGKINNKKSFFWYCQPYDVSGNYLAKLGFFFNTKVFTCGQELKDRYAKLIGSWAFDKIITVGHGIYFPHYQFGKNIGWGKKIKILYAGRTSPIKDVPTLQKAVHLLGDKVSLEIISNYSYTENATIFKHANIFVNSSKGYSLDKTLLEALVCNVISLGSDNAYPMFRHDFPELIFKAGDSQDLADKIKWLIDHPQKAIKITTRAKQYVKTNFDLNKLMNKIVETFKNEV